MGRFGNPFIIRAVWGLWLLSLSAYPAQPSQHQDRLVLMGVVPLQATITASRTGQIQVTSNGDPFRWEIVRNLRGPASIHLSANQPVVLRIAAP